MATSVLEFNYIVFAMGTRPRGAEFLNRLAKASQFKGLAIIYPRLHTESVDMSVLQFPSFSSQRPPTQTIVAGSILSVAQRFTERNCPRDALVQHAVFGVGTVVHCQGHVRHVDFEIQVSKQAADLTDDERPIDIKPESLVSVSWISLNRHVVNVKSLSELQRKATDKYLRWAS